MKPLKKLKPVAKKPAAELPRIPLSPPRSVPAVPRPCTPPTLRPVTDAETVCTTDPPPCEASHMARAGTLSSLLSGVKLDPKDWRTPFQGKSATLYHEHFNKASNSWVRKPGDDLQWGVFALPRDADPGGDGAKARAQGMICYHRAIAEDGETLAADNPLYLTRSEVALLTPTP